MEGTIVIVQVEHPTPVAVPEETENESFDKSFVSVESAIENSKQNGLVGNDRGFVKAD
jgi:hypothetical protein